MSTISDIENVSLENFILTVTVVNFISLSFIPGCEVQFPTKAQDNYTKPARTAGGKTNSA